MISVNDFKTGLTIEFDGSIWKVQDFQHVKPGKGAAFVRSKLKNLRTGAVLEKTFRAGEKVEAAQIDRRKMQYLYDTGSDLVFMDTDNYEQVELPHANVEYEMKFLTSISSYFFSISANCLYFSVAMILFFRWWGNAPALVGF